MNEHDALDTVLSEVQPTEVTDLRVIEAARAELAALRATVEAQAKQIETMKAALVQIRDADSDVCPRCEGNGAVYADGKAHSYPEGAPTIACPQCGGSGRIYDEQDAREIATAVLSSAPSTDALFEVVVNHKPDIISKDEAERFRAVNTAGTPPSVAVVPLERLREIEWALHDAIIRDRNGGAIYVRIHRCPACHRIERPKAEDARAIQHVEHLFGHAPGCWLGKEIRDAEREKP